MSQQELVKRVVDILARLGIPYMVTGSVVSSIQGEPRATHDVDVVVELGYEDVGPLLNAFSPPDFYAEEMSVRMAVRESSMFCVIDINDGGKIDFWLLKDTPFDRSRFQRRYEESVMGLEMTVSAPEDTILAKLDRSKRSGGSQKQFQDALRVYELQYDRLDLDYLDDWAQRLEVVDLLKRLKDESETL